MDLDRHTSGAELSDQLPLEIPERDALFAAYMACPGLSRRIPYSAAIDDELVGKCLRILMRRQRMPRRWRRA